MKSIRKSIDKSFRNELLGSLEGSFDRGTVKVLQLPSLNKGEINKIKYFKTSDEVRRAIKQMVVDIDHVVFEKLIALESEMNAKIDKKHIRKEYGKDDQSVISILYCEQKKELDDRKNLPWWKSYNPVLDKKTNDMYLLKKLYKRWRAISMLITIANDSNLTNVISELNDRGTFYRALKQIQQDTRTEFPNEDDLGNAILGNVFDFLLPNSGINVECFLRDERVFAGEQFTYDTQGLNLNPVLKEFLTEIFIGLQTIDRVKMGKGKQAQLEQIKIHKIGVDFLTDEPLALKF